MKKLWPLLLLLTCPLQAEISYVTIFNPVSGRPDFVSNLGSATIGDLGFGIQVLNGGVLQGGATWFDFTGTGCTASVTGGTATINCTGGGGGGGGGSGALFNGSVATAVSTWTIQGFPPIFFGSGGNVGFATVSVMGSSYPWSAAQTFGSTVTMRKPVTIDTPGQSASPLTIKNTGFTGIMTIALDGNNVWALTNNDTGSGRDGIVFRWLNSQNLTELYPFSISSGSLIGLSAPNPTSRLDINGGSVTVRGDLAGIYIVEPGSMSAAGIEVRQSSIATQNYTMVFASAPDTTTGNNHVIITQIDGSNYLIGSGGDSVGLLVTVAQWNAMSSTTGLRIDEIQADVSTHSIRIDELQADLSTASVAIINLHGSTNTIIKSMTDINNQTLGSTTPYKTFSIQGGSMFGVGISSANENNYGFPMISTYAATDRYNLFPHMYTEMKNSTTTRALFSARMPFEWDASTLGWIVSWIGSSGTANTNMKIGIIAIAVSSGSSSLSVYPSSTTNITTYKSGYQMAESTVAVVQVLGNPKPGSWVQFMLFRDGSDAKDTWEGFARILDVTIFYRKAVWDGRFR